MPDTPHYFESCSSRRNVLLKYWPEIFQAKPLFIRNSRDDRKASLLEFGKESNVTAEAIAVTGLPCPTRCNTFSRNSFPLHTEQCACPKDYKEIRPLIWPHNSQSRYSLKIPAPLSANGAHTTQTASETQPTQEHRFKHIHFQLRFNSGNLENASSDCWASSGTAPRLHCPV